MINWLLTRALVCLFSYNILYLSFSSLVRACFFIRFFFLLLSLVHFAAQIMGIFFFNFCFVVAAYSGFNLSHLLFFSSTFEQCGRYFPSSSGALLMNGTLYTYANNHRTKEYRRNPRRNEMLFQYVIGSFITKITFSRSIQILTKLFTGISNLNFFETFFYSSSRFIVYVCVCILQFPNHESNPKWMWIAKSVENH